MTSGAGTGGAGPLAGVSVLVPRSAGQSGDLSARLRALGAGAVDAPTISIQPTRDPEALSSALARAAEGDFDWVAFTSPNAVSAVLDLAGAEGLGRARLAVVGSGTRRALAERGREPDLVPGRSTARGLAAELADGAEPGRVLLPRADIASSGLPRALEDAGWDVEEVEAYRTVPVRELPEGVEADLRAGRVDVIAFTSGSTARSLVGLLDGPPPGAARVVTIGPTTSAVCEQLGMRVTAEADPHDLDGLVDAIIAASARGV